MIKYLYFNTQLISFVMDIIQIECETARKEVYCIMLLQQSFITVLLHVYACIASFIKDCCDRFYLLLCELGELS